MNTAHNITNQRNILAENLASYAFTSNCFQKTHRTSELRCNWLAKGYSIYNQVQVEADTHVEMDVQQVAQAEIQLDDSVEHAQDDSVEHAQDDSVGHGNLAAGTLVHLEVSLPRTAVAVVLDGLHENLAQVRGQLAWEDTHTAVGDA